MIQLAGEHGLSKARCIAGTALTHDETVDPSREITGLQELDVLRNILRELHPSVPFAFLAGQRYHLTTHGMLGFAIMSSANGWGALDVTMRYFDLSFSFNKLGFEADQGQGRLIYDDSDNPDDLRAALVARDVGALVSMELESLGRVVPALAIEFRAPRPAYADPFKALFGVTPRYNAETNCIRFDLAALDIRVPMADEHGRRVSEDQCKAQIEERRLRSGLAGRVHGRIMRTLGDFPSMQAVAAELGMSVRTLRNRLARESTSYRELLEQARERFAEQLLASDMTIDAIADRLGYADTSSFVAAFKRWKGMPPRRYREATQQQRTG
jgi:AraC-like DNA-binding protein